jgi:large subunit ribosomal protein L5
MKEKFNLKNDLAVPKLVKIVINVGISGVEDKTKVLENVSRDLISITGQRPIKTKVKKSVSAFKIRDGMFIGAKVTLRGEKMLSFLDRLINIALPRVRDFKGLSNKSFDGHGNYSLGIKEQLIFPEIEYDSIDKIRGMDVIIVTTARNDEQSHELLSLYGMPFKKNIS